MEASVQSYVHEIKEWKLEANEENNDRYFLNIEEVSHVESGAASFVIGRKGCGKTAIAENISGLQDYDTFVRRLSFKNFPFNELYKHKDVKYTSSQYITLWKYIIYSAVCEMMSNNESIDIEAKEPLKKAFDIDFSGALSRSISKITQQNAGLTIMKMGATGSYAKTFFPNDTPWADRVDALEVLISEYIDDSKYYILFDELDEDYKDVLDLDRRDQYFELIKSLLKAVTHVRVALGRKFCVRPIVFLRDDIYDLVDDPDSNKWDDIAVKLKWSEERLKSLAAFRISRAVDQDGDLLTFDEAMAKLFRFKHIKFGFKQKGKRPVFNHILNRTLLRPRDVISYIREVASIVYETKHFANDDVIRDADEAFSIRFSKEFINEMHSVVPYIREVFDILSDIRKQTLTIHEFEEKYNALREEKPEMLSFEITCRFLFHFSVIGNQPSQSNTEVFKYKNQNARMNFNESIIIHRGLLKALQIV